MDNKLYLPFMKKIIFFVLTLLLLGACSSDDTVRFRNPYILNIDFAISLNTNLPQYSILQFPGNAAYIPNVGNRGVFVINTGTGIRAWEATDPNHEIRECSTMELNGIEVTCPCEGTTYNLYTGLAKGEDKEYPLLEYRTSKNGNLISINN